ncbi:MAG TPA: hypothetical protein VKB25_01050 [Conexibacter sp.]|nr:hypothetical protein [Conexibacter sp.]
MTGDVFRDLPIPGIDPTPYSMIVSHPCSMRRGVALVDRLQAMPVIAYQRVEFARWADGFVRVLPLPDFPAAGTHHAVNLNEIGMVDASILALERRVACLSERAIALLLQRFFKNQSRVVVSLSRIEEAFGGVMEEIALWEEWNEQLASARVERGEGLDAVMHDEGVAFDEVVGAAAQGTDSTLRDRLSIASERTAVRRTVRQEIKQRLASVGE